MLLIKNKLKLKLDFIIISKRLNTGNSIKTKKF